MSGTRPRGFAWSTAKGMRRSDQVVLWMAAYLIVAALTFLGIVVSETVQLGRESLGAILATTPFILYRALLWPLYLLNYVVDHWVGDHW
jgi:hypothetical protein